MKYSLTHEEMKTALLEVLRNKINSTESVPTEGLFIPINHCYFELIMDGVIVDTYGELFFTYDTDYQYQVHTPEALEALCKTELT